MKTRRRFARTLALTLGLGALYGCSGGLSCGSGSGCLSAYPYPMTTALVPNGTAFVDEGVRMRMTQDALDFLTANIRPLLLTAFETDPADPDVIRVSLTGRQELTGGFALGESPPSNPSTNEPGERHPTEIFIDAADFANSITAHFVDDSGDGIRIRAENVPVGIDARVFFSTGVLGATATAACDLFGTNGSLGGRPYFTTFTLEATILPAVGYGADCDNHAAECLRISVRVDDVQLGAFGSGDIEVEKPPLVGCPAPGDGPDACSEECSDTVFLVDGAGDRECQLACFVGDLGLDLVTALGGLLNDLLRPALRNLLQGAITDALADFDGSPLAAAGRLNLAGFAPGILPESALDLGYAVAPTQGAFDVNAAPGAPAGARGMDLIFKSGFEAAPPADGNLDNAPVPHPCVRRIQGADFARIHGGSEFVMPDAAPLSGVFDGRTYHLGASVGAATLNQALFAAYNSGALCIEANTDGIHRLTAGSSAPFQLTAGTLDLLTQGKLRQYTRSDAPAVIALAPNQPPLLTYGSGEGGEGHLKIDWPGVEVSFYVLINERYTRVFAVAADVAMQLSVFEDPQTGTLRVSVVDGPRVANFVENYNELVPGVAFTEVLESLIGIAFDAALGDGLEFNFDVGPTLSGALGVPISVDFVGLETLPVNRREFLNVYLSLDNTPQPQPRMAAVERPRLATEPGVVRLAQVGDVKKILPTGEVRIESDDMIPLGAPSEYFARVDFGAWRGPLRPDVHGALTVRDPKLRLMGQHAVVLRARLVGEPGTLGAPAEPVVVWVDTEAPRVELVQAGHTVVARGFDVGSRPDELRWQWQMDDGAWSEPTGDSVRPLVELLGRRVAVRAIDAAGNISRASGLDLAVARKRAAELAPASGGCAHAGVGASWLAGLGAVALLLVRRRRQ